jgi:hypothetical protein
MKIIAAIAASLLVACTGATEDTALFGEPVHLGTIASAVPIYGEVHFYSDDANTRDYLREGAKAWDYCGARRAIVDDEPGENQVPVHVVPKTDPDLRGHSGVTMVRCAAELGEGFCHAEYIKVMHPRTDGRMLSRNEALEANFFVNVEHEMGHALAPWMGGDHWGDGIMAPDESGAGRSIYVQDVDCEQVRERTTR